LARQHLFTVLDELADGYHVIRPDNEAPPQLNYFDDCFRATAVEAARVGDLVCMAVLPRCLRVGAGLLAPSCVCEGARFDGSFVSVVPDNAVNDRAHAQAVIIVANALRDGDDLGCCFRVYAFERLPAGPPIYTHYMGRVAPAIDEIQFWYGSLPKGRCGDVLAGRPMARI
jgi:hypothetical protein